MPHSLIASSWFAVALVSACSDDAATALPGSGDAGSQASVDASSADRDAAASAPAPADASRSGDGDGGGIPGCTAAAPMVLDGFVGAGSKSPVAPVWFERFSTTTEGETASAVGYQRAARHDVHVDMSDGILSCRGSLRFDTGPGADVGGGIGEVFPHVYNDLPAGSLQVVRSFWIKVVKTVSGSGSNGPMQLKSVRTGTVSPSDNTPHYSGLPAFKTSLYLNAEIGNFNSVYSTWDAIDDNDATHTQWSRGTPSWKTGGWNRLTMIFTHNSLGAANGRLQYWVNETQILNRTDCAPRSTTEQFLQYVQLFPGFDFKFGDEWTVKFADDYVDNTLARVELTDQADYATSSQWAMQGLTAWSDSSITIAPNFAGFASGQTGYFHVFDAAGAVVDVVSRTIP